MKYVLLASFAVVIACLSACSGKTGSPAPVQDTLVATVDSVNILPLLNDADGSMDSLFRAKGYLYGPDIINASRAGDVNASYLLAQMYSYGIAGATPDRRKVFKLYISLADSGINEAKAMAGYMYLYGYGVDADPTKGLDLITEAANDGNGLAYLFMGNFYSQADPSSRNLALAKACYIEAEALGISEATILLNNLDNAHAN